MRFSSFTYLVGQGLHNLRANRLMTFASMGVLTVCMLLIGAAYLLGVNIDAMVEYIGDQNETVVYMDQGASDDQIAAADTAIRSTEHVVGVTYMSPQDVLAVYSDMLSSYTNLQDAFANDNPFYPNYRVVVDSPDNIEAVSQQLRQIDGVYQVNAPLEMSKVFVSLQKVVSYACYGIVLVLAIVNAFKIFKEVYFIGGSYPNESIYTLQHYMNNKFSKLDYQDVTTAAYSFALIVLVFIFLLYRTKSVRGDSAA